MRPFAAGILLILFAWPCRGSSVVGWRTDTTGRYPDADPPVKWSAGENVAWKTKLPGKSPSTPIIVGDRIFTTAHPCVLVCLDKQSGKILWQKDNRNDTPSRKKPWKYMGEACCTPVSNGTLVFAFYNNGVGAAYDLD